MRVIPGNRRRGGAFFQMVLFVMMLTSTALMYYYFQRARALERDLAAIRRGELNPQDAGSTFGFSWLKNDDLKGTAQGAEDEVSGAARHGVSGGETAPQVTERQPTAQNIGADERAARAEGTQNTQVDVEDAGSTASGVEAERTETQPAAVVDAGRNDGALQDPEDMGEEEMEPADTAQPRSTPAPTGDSLYDMTPEPVKVRAPRR